MIEQCIRNILRSDLFIPVDQVRSELTIKEGNRDAKLRRLTLQRTPRGLVAFQLDHRPTGALATSIKDGYKQLSWLINPSHPAANKKCDAVIVVSGDEGKADVFLIDLKSDSFNKPECRTQLFNSRLYIEYLLNLVKEYHGLNIACRFHCIIFHTRTRGVLKAATQQRNQTLNDKTTNGVRYIEVVVGGFDSATAKIAFSRVK